MAAVLRWNPRLLPILFLLLWRASFAQIFYDDQVALEQLNPFIGAEFLQYPIVDQYDVPDVRITSADADEGDSSESYDTDDGSRAARGQVEFQKAVHVTRRAAERHKYNALRLKRQVAMQEDPVFQAQQKLENSIKAAKALTNIEKELGTDPSFIEQKTDKLKNQLGSEMTKLEKLESQQDEPSKKSKYKNMKDVVKEDMKEAQSILSLIVKLEAAKYLANERARQKLKEVQRDRISNAPPPLPVVSAVSSQSANPFQPPYFPMLPSYASPYQSSSYPQYSGSYPGSSPFQESRSPWSSSPLGMNQVNSQVMNPLPAQMAPYGPVNPPVAAYSSEQNEPEEPELTAHSDDIAPPTPPSQNIAGKQHDIENVKPPTKLASKPASPEHYNHQQPPASMSSVSPFNKPKVNPPKEIPKVDGNKSPPMAATAPAQRPTNLVPLLKQSAPLTASPSATNVQPNMAAASRFFNSLRMNQNLPAPVTHPLPSTSYSGFMKSPAKDMQAFKPAVSHTPEPLAFKPETPHVTSPQFFKPAASQITSPQSFRPAVPPPIENTMDTFSDDEENTNGILNAMQDPVAFEKPHDSSVAYSSEQPLPGQYPSNAYYPWNLQSLPTNAPMYSWNPNAYYPQYPPAYTLPVSPPVQENPLLRKILTKLHDTTRASKAVTKIEQAIGLSPDTVRNLIDNVKSQARQEISRYEQDAKIEREGINAAKSRLKSKEEGSNEQKLKDKLNEEEEKLNSVEQKEKAAKLKVNEVNQIEKILTIIEAAKFSALQRAKSKLNGLNTESSEIRKRDLKDLEQDMKADRKRRRNQITIWLKGSRNKVDTSHFVRAGHRHGKSRVPEGTDDSLEDENTNNVLPGDAGVRRGHPFAVEKRTQIPEPKLSLRDTLMLRMLHKMDGLFSMQTKILKELQHSHHKKWKWHKHAWKKPGKSVSQEQKRKRSTS